MAEKENNRSDNTENRTSPEEKREGEELKDSLKFEDFASSEKPKEESAGKAPGVEQEGKIEAISVPVEEYERLKSELKETKEMLLRVAADYENYKKRVAKEMEEHKKYANEALLRDMLETADHLELTLLHSKQVQNKNEELIKGFEITLKGYLELLKRYGVSQIEISENAIFDPNIHEAIAAVESEEIPAGHIIRVERKGYFLRDRLLRPALVVVSKGKPEEKEKAQSEEGKDKPDNVCIAEPELKKDEK